MMVGFIVQSLILIVDWGTTNLDDGKFMSKEHNVKKYIFMSFKCYM
jgi:hypothetical protein